MIDIAWFNCFVQTMLKNCLSLKMTRYLVFIQVSQYSSVNIKIVFSLITG